MVSVTLCIAPERVSRPAEVSARSIVSVMFLALKGAGCERKKLFMEAFLVGFKGRSMDAVGQCPAHGGTGLKGAKYRYRFNCRTRQRSGHVVRDSGQSNDFDSKALRVGHSELQIGAAEVLHPHEKVDLTEIDNAHVDSHLFSFPGARLPRLDLLCRCHVIQMESGWNLIGT